MARNILNFSNTSHYGDPNAVGEICSFIKYYGLSFNLGNSAKYICRAGNKVGESRAKDLIKALDYIAIELDIGVEIKTFKKGTEFERYFMQEVLNSLSPVMDKICLWVKKD